MALWYYGSNGNQHGPVEEAELRALIASGAVGSQTLVWCDGMGDWKPLAAVPQLGGQVVAATSYASPAYPGYYPPVLPNSGAAIASMVCGIVGICTCYFAGLIGIAAVICGHIALGQIRDSAVPMGGRGMAIAGLTLGYLGILITAAFIAFFVIGIAFT